MPEQFLADFAPYWHDSITQMLLICKLHMMWISHLTKSLRYAFGLRFGECGGRKIALQQQPVWHQQPCHVWSHINHLMLWTLLLYYLLYYVNFFSCPSFVSVSCPQRLLWKVSLFVYVSVSPVMPLFSSVKFLCLSLSVCFPISLIT